MKGWWDGRGRFWGREGIGGREAMIGGLRVLLLGMNRVDYKSNVFMYLP